MLSTRSEASSRVIDVAVAAITAQLSADESCMITLPEPLARSLPVRLLPVACRWAGLQQHGLATSNCMCD